MISVHAPIDEALVAPLEEHFCGWQRSPWSLSHDLATGAFAVTGYFDTGEEALAAWSELVASFPALPVSPVTDEVREEDWREAYKHHFHPWAHDDLHWVPAWQHAEYPVPADATVVYLDPGLAFGTGNHETTRLMARRLLAFRDERGAAFGDLPIIDAGCGSGILAISAVKLGARQVYAFDHDAEAARVTRENAAANGLAADALEIAHAGLHDGLEGRRADLILANIQADVLQIYVDELLAATAPGGWLALSGILAEEADKIATFFRDKATAAWGGYVRDIVQPEGNWAEVSLQRPPA